MGVEKIKRKTFIFSAAPWGRRVVVVAGTSPCPVNGGSSPAQQTETGGIEHFYPSVWQTIYYIPPFSFSLFLSLSRSLTHYNSIKNERPRNFCSLTRFTEFQSSFFYNFWSFLLFFRFKPILLLLQIYGVVKSEKIFLRIQPNFLEFQFSKFWNYYTIFDKQYWIPEIGIRKLCRGESSAHPFIPLPTITCGRGTNVECADVELVFLYR